MTEQELCEIDPLEIRKIKIQVGAYRDCDMTEQEMRELDAWIAEYGFGAWLEDTTPIGPHWVGPHPRDNDAYAYLSCILELYSPSYRSDSGLPFFSGNPAALTAVKREIERRGWSWRSASCYNGGYHFDIFGDMRWTDGEMESVVIAPKLSEVRAETEELAGCLAFRQAVEAEGSKDV